MKKIINDLKKLSEKSYKEFSHSLSPNLDIDEVLGVRIPKLRIYQKEIGIDYNFLNELPHKYLEEYQLHGLMINEIKDYDTCVKQLDKLLPYINSWAITDIIKPKCFKDNKKDLYPCITRWVKSKDTYTIRYGVVCLMYYFLDNDFKPKHLTLIRNIKSNEYYVNMARAWYIAEGLVNHYSDVISILENKQLDKWTHNKAISKANDSFRISDETKKYLKTLR